MRNMTILWTNFVGIRMNRVFVVWWGDTDIDPFDSGCDFYSGDNAMVSAVNFKIRMEQQGFTVEIWQGIQQVQ